MFLDTAWSIGARLCREAIWDGDRCNWLGDAMELVSNEWRVVHKSCGPDLYSGTSGIALFLARLHRYRPDPLLALTARGAVGHALSRIGQIPESRRTAFYTGWLGIAWALLQTGELLDEPAWIAGADRMIASQLGRESERHATDIIGGIAGSVTVLLAIWRRTWRDALLQDAIRHGESLLRLANRDGDAMSWTTLNPARRNPTRDLTGYSHGTAGIALALLELAAITGREDFREGAYAGFRYERRWYSPRHLNWPDFRSDPPAYSLTWCHGAPGIGLSRLRAYELTGDPEILLEAGAAIQGAYRTAIDNYSLCHGLGGNAETFLLASLILGNPKCRALANSIGQRRIENAGAPWPCGVPGGGESPNLMIGLAGIGYFYLRLHDPAAVPSVLLVV